jgi:hypothetical protein
MRKPGHTSSTNTKEWKGLSKCVNAEGLKGYHANGSRIMTNLRGWSGGEPFAERYHLLGGDLSVLKQLSVQGGFLG